MPAVVAEAAAELGWTARVDSATARRTAFALERAGEIEALYVRDGRVVERVRSGGVHLGLVIGGSRYRTLEQLD